MYDWVLNTPMEGFVQDALRYVNQPLLLQLSVQEQLVDKTTTNKLAVSNTTDTSLKSQISIDVFLIEEYGYVPLRKELLIAHFAKRFKIATLGRSC